MAPKCLGGTDVHAHFWVLIPLQKTFSWKHPPSLGTREKNSQLHSQTRVLHKRIWGRGVAGKRNVADDYVDPLVLPYSSGFINLERLLNLLQFVSRLLI